MLKRAAPEPPATCALAYYAEHFPIDLLHGWLAGCEVAFFYERTAPSRYLSFATGREFWATLTRRRPTRVEAGATYAGRPAKDGAVTGSKLRFDLDVTDYDDVRGCCSGPRMCGECWPLVDAAAAELDERLGREFGFEARLWVFSGRRGAHCWVGGARAERLSEEVRAALCAVLSSETVRLDAEVTRQWRHLLKVPFSLHPATGRVCVPFEPGTGFDPFSAPTAADAVRTGGAALAAGRALFAAFTERCTAELWTDPTSFGT